MEAVSILLMASKFASLLGKLGASGRLLLGAVLLRLWETVLLSHRIPDKIEISIEFLYQVLVCFLDQLLLLLAGMLVLRIWVDH